MKNLLMLSLLTSLVACGDPTDPTESATPDGGAFMMTDGASGQGDLDALSAADSTARDEPLDQVGTEDPLDLSDATGAASSDADGPTADLGWTPNEDVDVTSDVDAGNSGSDPDDSTSPPSVVDELETLGGGVLIFELASSMLDQAGAGARFTDPVEALETGQAVHGPCQVTVADPNAPPEAPLVGLDAGTITVEGTTTSLTLASIDEGAAGTGYASGLPEDLEALLPAGGALLHLSAEGGADILAFDMYVQVPEPVTLSAPATGLFESVSTSSPLEVIWNQGTGDMTLVTFTPLSATFQLIAGYGLVCQQEGDLGSLSIPEAALKAVKNSGVSKVAIGVTRMRTSTTNAGDWLVPAAVTRSSGGLLGLD
jgi:hypothetical protein